MKIMEIIQFLKKYFVGEGDTYSTADCVVYPR